MPPLDERALVEQGNAVALVRELIELLQESVPGRLVGVGVNRVDRKDVPIVRIGQDRVSVLPMINQSGLQSPAAVVLLVLLDKSVGPTLSSAASAVLTVFARGVRTAI